MSLSSSSIFEIFKIGIGPSSSHTVGLMLAAGQFVSALASNDLLLGTRRIGVDLYGSLALTGRGHATDRAIILGLCGEHPQSVEVGTIESRLADIRELRRLTLKGLHPVEFIEPRDLLFHKDETLPQHSNGVRFSAFDADGALLFQEVYYSIGGGFIVREGAETRSSTLRTVPHPFGSAAELLDLAEKQRIPIWQIVFENEKASHSEGEVRSYIERIWETMRECIMRGLQTEGILPGGLKVRRRAPGLARRLETDGERRRKAGEKEDPLHALDWVNVFAMAVNEENAAGGRMVTAPTNGVAGVIPAVALLRNIC